MVLHLIAPVSAAVRSCSTVPTRRQVDIRTSPSAQFQTKVFFVCFGVPTHVDVVCVSLLFCGLWCHVSSQFSCTLPGSSHGGIKFERSSNHKLVAFALETLTDFGITREDL